MKKYIFCSIFAYVFVVSNTNPVYAQGGFMGQCMAKKDGKVYHIRNGNFSKELCFKLARQCTGDENVSASYFSSPKLITGNPLETCSQVLRKESK